MRRLTSSTSARPLTHSTASTTASPDRDVLAILRVVGLALGDRNLGDRISEVAKRLHDGIGTALPNVLDNRAALKITDPIRIAIADAWAEYDAQRD